jgi:hypothetical protein
MKNSADRGLESPFLVNFIYYDLFIYYTYYVVQEVLLLLWLFMI